MTNHILAGSVEMINNIFLTGTSILMFCTINSNKMIQRLEFDELQLFCADLVLSLHESKQLIASSKIHNIFLLSHLLFNYLLVCYLFSFL